MAVFLVFYWRFLKGWGWPQSTTAARRASLRAEPLSAQVWRWSLLAGGLGLAASIVLFIVSHRLIRWPQAPHSDLTHIPLTTLLPSLLMSAMVAGISEEAGFRGYMQGPLERRYGPAMGIADHQYRFRPRSPEPRHIFTGDSLRHWLGRTLWIADLPERLHRTGDSLAQQRGCPGIRCRLEVSADSTRTSGVGERAR